MSFCKSLTGFRPERQLCEAERKRFAASRADVQAAGGVLQYAVAKADDEYRTALAAPEWHAPRVTAGTWSYQLSQLNEIVPDQFVSESLVNSVRLSGEDSGTVAAVGRMASVLLDAKTGWGIQAVDLGTHEMLPEEAVKFQSALCSTWAYLLSGAAMVRGWTVETVLMRQENDQYHVEAYVKIDGHRYWHIPWSLNGEKSVADGEVVTRLPENGRLSRADLAMVYTINSVLSSDMTDDQQRAVFQKLSQWHTGPAIQTWLQEITAEFRVADARRQ